MDIRRPWTAIVPSSDAESLARWGQTGARERRLVVARGDVDVGSRGDLRRRDAWL